MQSYLYVTLCHQLIVSQMKKKYKFLIKTLLLDPSEKSRYRDLD